jgi:hypothetical protein
VSLAPVINTKLRISPQIFVIIRNGPYMGYSEVWGKLIHEKISCQTPFKIAILHDGKKVFIDDLLDKKKMLTYSGGMKGAVKDGEPVGVV